MPKNPELNLVLHLHGPCVVCLEPLDITVKNEIALLKRSGSFPRFGPAGEMVVSSTSLSWVHSVHLQ